MTTLTVTAKGQVTLKKDLLQYLGVEPGQKVEINKLSDGQIIVKAAVEGGSINEAFGILQAHNPQKRALSVDEINNIIARGWAKQK